MNDLSADKPLPVRTTEADQASETADRIVVLVDGSDASIRAVHLGDQLAAGYGVPWEAIFAETSAARTSDDSHVGEVLALAARRGAMVYRLPAASVADAVLEQIDTCKNPHVVATVAPRGFVARAVGRSLVEELSRRRPGIVLHLVSGDGLPNAPATATASAPLASYGLAAAGSLVTLGLVLLLRVLGSDYLTFLFLFPVLAAAARLGLKPSLLAAFVSAAGFNILFLSPLRAFNPMAVQTWLMFAVLSAVAVYASWLTASLRTRIALSDRSAQESATLAGFAQKLTRVADWSSTGQTVCLEVQQLLNVRTLLVREVDGKLQLVDSEPAGATLDPLDQTALEWAWQHGQPTGSGASVFPEAGWQFHPLMTSLGVLAVLGLARDDGRNPIPAEREVLLGTIIAQAALALERLRLEDRARHRAPQRRADEASSASGA